ncbi:MAG: YHS domain-containing (seleno)protein [Methyloceanibacter sp.]
MWKALVLTLFGAVTPLAAHAADELNVSKGATLAGPGLAAHGYDVVAFFTDGKAEIGSDKYAVAHTGGTYRFVSQAHLDAFKADPAKYEPAYGGFCAYGVALGKKFDGDPRYWKIVGGKLYLNLNEDIQAEWSKDIPVNLAKAETNWGRIIATPVAAL